MKSYTIPAGVAPCRVIPSYANDQEQARYGATMNEKMHHPTDLTMEEAWGKLSDEQRERIRDTFKDWQAEAVMPSEQLPYARFTNVWMRTVPIFNHDSYGFVDYDVEEYDLSESTKEMENDLQSEIEIENTADPLF